MGVFPSIGVSVPKPRPRRSTTTNHNQSTNNTTAKKDGGKIKLPSEKDALSYRSPPFIGTWNEYNKFLTTGGLVLPK